MSESQGHHSFPWRVTGIVALVVLVASVLAGFLLSRDRVGSAPAPTQAPTATASVASEPPLEERQQLTVLLTIRDQQRSAVSNVLLGVGGELGFVSELLLPRELLLPTLPPQRLAEVDDPTGPRTAEQPLETLLGVRVDAIVDLDRLAWTGLIDATGSRVDVEVAEEPGSFVLVLDRVLKGLPYDPQTVGQLLTGLGSMARTTVTNEDASYLLSLVGRNLRGDDLRREWLPVTFVRSGQDRAAIADVAAADTVVRELFPLALLTPGHGGEQRVVVQRAGATLGAATATRLGLMEAGFGVVEDRSATQPVAATEVIVPGASEEAQAAGRAVAEALGLPAAAVRTSDAATAAVDVRVLLGPDAAVTSP